MLITDINTYGLFKKYDQMAVQQAQQQGLQIGYAKNNPSQAIQQQTKQSTCPVARKLGLPIDLSKVRLSSEFGVEH